jgi:1,4-alpha-glucan branching enzyme
MLLPCPHCRQPLEIDPAWMGQTVDCPLCSAAFPVPELPAAAAPPVPPAAPRLTTNNRHLEAWQRRKKVRRLVLLLLGAGLIAGGVWGFNHWRGETPPRQAFIHLWEHFSRPFREFLSPPPPPTPDPAPVPSPPVPPPPEPSPTVTPEPPPEPADPVAWLRENPDRWPAELVLAEPVKFPALYQGRQVGEVTVPPGSTVGLAAILEDGVELRFRDGKTLVPPASTNLRDVAAAEMGRPGPGALAEEPAPAPEPVLMPATVVPPRPEALGAQLQRDEQGRAAGAVFRVWAPHAETVSVVGHFNKWDPRKAAMIKDEASAVWSVEVPAARAGDEYMFLINGDTERRDPRAREISAGGKSVLHDPAAFDWQDTTPPRHRLEDLVIYQLHPGTFHDPDPADDRPGTLRDATAKLDHLAGLGVNTVLLMPVNEFAGDHSWGYNPSDLFAIERAYGGPDALREFVREAHRRGLAVHVDVVHNHYGPGDLDLRRFDGYGGGETGAGIYFYEDAARADTPWGPRPDFGRPEVRRFIADQIRMWFDEFRIDGLRWDSVANIIRYDEGRSPNPDGEQLVDEISRMIRTEYPDKISIAEDAVGDDRFDASWEYDFHHAGQNGRDGLVPQLLRPDAETDLEDIARRLDSDLGPRRVIYAENHDETGRLNGKRRFITDIDEEDPHGLRARRKHALAAALTLTASGIPLIFMGQELLEDREFHDTNPLDWAGSVRAERASRLYRDLIRLRRNLDGRGDALTAGRLRVMKTDTTNGVLVYRRQSPGPRGDTFVVAANLTGEPVESYRLTFPEPGRWRILLNTDDPAYGEDFTGLGSSGTTSNTATTDLGAYSVQIWGTADPR